MEVKESDGEKFYRWVPTADVSMSTFINNDSNSKYHYLKDFVEIEEISRELLMDLGIENVLRIKSLRNIIEILVRNEIVSNRWLQDEYMSFINLSNRIRHGEKIMNSDMEKIKISRSSALHMKAELFEGYSNFIIKKCLIPLNYEVIQNYRISNNEGISEFDVIAKHEKKADIIFEVKYRGSLRINDIRQTIERVALRLKKYNELNNKNSKLILLIYVSEVDSKILARVSDLLKDFIIEELYNRIRVLIVSRTEKLFDCEKITRFIENFEIQQ